MTEGTLCSLTVSSLAASSTLHFESLGFEELAEHNQEKGEFNKTQQLQIEQKYSKVQEKLLLGRFFIITTWQSTWPALSGSNPRLLWVTWQKITTG
jgi:hypothetical protein